uniref:Tyr recombinase domain-containing protein n=1 Tax=Prymnesium polylepis TaxID=72548 RepID=A0A7S4I6U0_9EUKA|mmetsp:Transcript_27368/g.67665  ORF Transcript_27368/g.67665 Transcript_27368/m.67665 type:complete len:533 (+) Transcript_27368:718-2316(+)
MMTEENAGEFGHGAHADEPSRATSIEQKLSNIATWFDVVLQDTLIANPGRNYNVKKMKRSLAKLLGRARVHEADVVEDEDDGVLQANTNLDCAYETATLDYLTTNTVHGTRAADNLLLDWEDITVNGVGSASGEVGEGEVRGVALKFQKTKNNTEQRDRPAKALQCLSCCTLGTGSLKVGKDGKQEGGGRICPAHLKMWLKGLQARDVGVAVEQLEGPVYGDYVKIENLPAGATLVKVESGSSSSKAPRLVLVVSREEEAAGLMYDRTVPFEVNGKYFWPPCAGVYFEVAGKGYAVHAWASAAGVTQRMRTLMRKINRRANSELIPSKRIEKMSSKSLRVTMATRLYRAGVPLAEIVEMGEWEDEAMARTYIRTLKPFAGTRRNMCDVVARKQVEPTPTVEPTTLVQPTPTSAVVVAASPASGEALAVAELPEARGEKRKLAAKVGREKEMAVCCPDKFVAQGGCVVCTDGLDKNPTLRQLWDELEGQPAGKVRKTLCENEYHCSCKQIQNTRTRLKERVRCMDPRRLEHGL